MLKLHIYDVLHGQHELDCVLVHLWTSKHWGCRDNLVLQVTSLINQYSWHIHVQVVLNALSGNHFDKLNIGVSLGDVI